MKVYAIYAGGKPQGFDNRFWGRELMVFGEKIHAHGLVDYHNQLAYEKWRVVVWEIPDWNISKAGAVRGKKISKKKRVK
jgi:hypothetical protein